tara:strand:- start:1159 stop:2154 length:996 start_codon:yes stop_codon:yes gene_type:complete
MSGSSLGDLNKQISEKSLFLDDLKRGISEVIVGQDELINKILIGVLSDGHILIEGVPGLAKTLTVNTIAQLIDTSFKRIQFTPDMLPADLIGTLIYNQKTGEFDTRKGPIFSNIILADEINRTPAKVQSALLEAMQEHQVTIGENSYFLERPFLVLATQNPIEQEGTYPLPEAQVDRFMFKLIVDYPEQNSERQVLRMNSNPNKPKKIKSLVSTDKIIESQKIINNIYVDQKIEDYVLNLIFATRDPSNYGIQDLDNIIDFGASPRATINLIRAAKARAFIEHRGYVTPEDIRYIGSDVLRHRIILTYEAQAEELTSDDIINRLFEVIEVP